MTPERLFDRIGDIHTLIGSQGGAVDQHRKAAVGDPAIGCELQRFEPVNLCGHDVSSLERHHQAAYSINTSIKSETQANWIDWCQDLNS